MKHIILIICLCLISSCAQTNSSTTTPTLSSDVFNKSAIAQNETITLNTYVVANWQSPYQSADIAVDLTIVTPSKQQLTLPGYYVSGQSGELSHWQFKFTPAEVGTYTVKVLINNNNMLQHGKTEQFTVSQSTLKGFLRSNDKWSFQYDNGQLFRGLGENFGWEKRDNDDSKFFKELHEKPRFNYDYMLKSLSEDGANIFRTWMIFWNLPVDFQHVDNNARYENTNERFNPSGIKRMNELLDIASKYDMKMILSLDSHAAFSGQGWNFNSYNTKNGGPAETVAEFFTSDEAKQRYKDKLRFMVAKWGYSSQIAAWEFFNEIDNVMYNGEHQHISDDIIVAWHKEMSEYLAIIDAHNHLITTSISHREVDGLFDLPSIDINQSHLYKVTNDIPEIISKFEKAHDAPYFVGEFSAEWDWSQNFDLIQEEMISDYKQGLWFGMFSPSPIMPLSWWWEYFDEKGTSAYFNHVKTINDLMLSTGNKALAAQSVNNSNAQLTTLALTNGKKAFVYVNNPSDTAQNFTLNNLPSLSHLDKIYDCESGEFIKVKHTGDYTLAAKQNWVIIYNL
ncbi:hypothetical protein [Thalassotalea sp. PLHSN55]|uniref:hypothetical protein n=1 Tax=Thalassotalea sp. PLHSN55 TaxID=3435888 RepID=UPI003F83A36C